MKLLGRKTKNACLMCVSPSASMFLQVVVTVLRCYVCLTGFYSCFYLFDLFKSVADGWKSVLHHSDEGVKWNVAVRCFPFLEETIFGAQRVQMLTVLVTYEGHNPKRATVLLSNKLINN